ncbi:MAG: hypothetical protein HY799_04935 [Nitrosomonadales bacterium]|nr:hypothetical protein [Nitrosomonadales bacterium]
MLLIEPMITPFKHADESANENQANLVFIVRFSANFSLSSKKVKSGTQSVQATGLP